MRRSVPDLLEIPAYGSPEAARYLRLPIQTLRYWCLGRGSIPPIIQLPSSDPPRLSYLNLLECHMLGAMRSLYNLRLPKVRRALKYLSGRQPSRHPLLYEAFETNRVDLFIREYEALINASGGGQISIEPILRLHLERIQPKADGLLMFFPFVEKRSAEEPRIISITPEVGFGKPVIKGTGISTAVISARFRGRDLVSDLAREYGVTEQEIGEAIRWEQTYLLAA